MSCHVLPQWGQATTIFWGGSNSQSHPPLAIFPLEISVLQLRLTVHMSQTRQQLAIDKADTHIDGTYFTLSLLLQPLKRNLYK